MSDGNHPGIIDFKGKSYVFGFNYTLNWEIADVKRERRSVCVAEMTYNPDGTIPKVPWWNKEGVPQVGTFNPYAQVEAATICYEKGVKTKPRGGDKQGVYVERHRERRLHQDQGRRFRRATERPSSPPVWRPRPKARTITLRIDSETGDPIGTLKVKPTGALDKWETQSCKITGARGVHDLYLKFFGNGTPLMNVDWWKFESK